MTGPPSPAPAAPDQVAGHRSARRRAASALVRRDAVPRTDPLRGHARATTVGVLLAALGLGAAALVGLVARPVDWHGAGVVVGAGSGALYVVAHGPDRLVPVPNVASARLVAAALATPGAPAPGAGAEPAEVDDAVLDAAPHSRPVGIADAPPLPPAGAPVPPVWSVCDTAVADPAPAPSGTRPRVRTTVRAGAAAPGRPLAPAEGVLLRDRVGGTWLVHDGVRSRVDTGDPAVVGALGLAGRTPRPATTSLLNALVEGPPLAVPAIANRGAPGPPALGGETVGGVVRLVGAGHDRFLLVAADGVQEVPPLVARLIRLSDPARAAVAVQAVPPGRLAAVPAVRAVAVDAYPAEVPVLVPPSDAPVTCVSATGAVPGTTLTVAPAPATPAVTTLARADGSGDGVDDVELPGTGVVVRGVPPGRPDAPGTTAVVSASGTVHGVPDARTAAVLGLGPAAPVPEAVLRVLPAGPSLSVLAATAPLG